MELSEKFAGSAGLLTALAIPFVTAATAFATSGGNLGVTVAAGGGAALATFFGGGIVRGLTGPAASEPATNFSEGLALGSYIPMAVAGVSAIALTAGV